MVMKENEFYSVVAKKRVTIPKSNIKIVTRNNRKFAVGNYKVNGKEYEAWKVLGMAKKTPCKGKKK